MTDIVERLREHAGAGDDGCLPYNVDEVLLREAADEIARLRDQVKFLHGLLDREAAWPGKET